MSKRNLLDSLKENEILVSDGATGTNLIERGLPRGKTPEEWVLENPDAVLNLHQDFIDAGSNIILTSTFGGSGVRLKKSNLGDEAEKINAAAVKLAIQAVADKDVLIAGSMGPLGEMMKPLGTLDTNTAENNYRQQAEVLSKSGADILLIETQFDLTESVIAVRAALSVSGLPVICSFSFDRGIKTMMGVSPTKFAQEFNGLGVTALGINCGKSLEDNLYSLKELSDATQLPIWFKPNAGLPKLNAEGHPGYDVSPEEMASYVGTWIENGARIIGGCCGTTPEHLKSIKSAVQSITSK